MDPKRLNRWKDSCLQFLSEHKISKEAPGSILRDVETMIGLFESGFISKTGGEGNIPLPLLPEINARISDPVEIHKNRAVLRDYPNIAGLLILLRAMNLVRIEKNTFKLDSGMLALWRGLNPVEQYFALLEALLFIADDSIIGKSQRRRMRDQFSGVLFFLDAVVSSRWKSFDEHCHLYDFEGVVSTWNTQLLIRFGFLEVETLPIEGRPFHTLGWVMGKARRTPWGQAVTFGIMTFLKKTYGTDSIYFLECPKDAGFGWLKPAFQEFFPEWKTSFALPATPAIQGTYILKVSLTGWRGEGMQIWRRLAVPHNCSLDWLSNLILQAFDFDDDGHLHEFRYRNNLGKETVCNHPEASDGPFSDEIGLGESGLPVKGTMKFHFDFGDDWEFLIKLEKIAPKGSYPKAPELIDWAGESPEQYPDYDE